VRSKPLLTTFLSRRLVALVMSNNRRQLRAARLNGSVAITENCSTAIERKQIGRQSDYNTKIARAIADRMIDGQTLRAFCQQNGMPDEGTIYRWIAQHGEFRQMYAHARELQAMRWAEEVLTISDDAHLDPQDRRIRVDTRKWLLSTVLPRIYGDKVTVAGDPAAPIVHVAAVDPKRLSGAELDALERFADARLAGIPVSAVARPLRILDFRIRSIPASVGFSAALVFEPAPLCCVCVGMKVTVAELCLCPRELLPARAKRAVFNRVLAGTVDPPTPSRKHPCLDRLSAMCEPRLVRATKPALPQCRDRRVQ